MSEQNNPNPLFETPKKARLTIICAVVAAVTLVAVIAYVIYSIRSAAADDSPSPSQSVSAPVQSEAPEEPSALVGIVPALTIDEAREMALADAGVAKSEADVSREALAQDNGIWVYEFRFRTEKAQYEYKLNANTGEVRSMVKETFAPPSAVVTDPPAPESAPAVETASPSAAPAVNPSTPTSAPAVSQAPASTPAPVPSQSTSMYIGSDQAKTIALNHAGLSADQVTFTKSSMDREHGTMVYEIEFRQGRTEYEYEIDASTGSILKYERDGAPAGQSTASAPPVSTPAAEPSAPVYITTEQAKAIALRHAGLSADQVTFDHAHMDREHGTMVYEIEFRQGRTEYEYEIDASNGNILSFEQDVD